MSFIILFLAVFVSGLAGLGLSGAKRNHIRLLTAFSGAFLLGLSILHLLPEVYTHGTENAGFFILGGFLLQVFLEYFSGGIEHGHSHAQHTSRIPWAILISLSIHSFVEAMPLAADHGHGHNQETLLTGIILHKIPVSIVLVIMLINAGLSKGKIIVIIAALAAMAPLGGFVANTAGHSLESAESFFNNMLGIVIGIFLHIATTILFEASDNHRFHLYKMVVILLGLGLAAAGS